MEEDIPSAQAWLKLSVHSIPKMYFLNLNTAIRNSRILGMIQNVAFTGNYKMSGKVLAKLLMSTNFRFEFQDSGFDFMGGILLHTVSSFLFSDTRKSYDASRAGLKVGPTRQLPGHQPKGALKRHWSNRKYGASKLLFPHAK
jgi:hypothetical protein